ncbi:DUF6496 domain-containing protein [Microvirga roseola]|uniref:DUF6496 domain-containing protein n=1 Tax=Microvirga roseola TaxID=2883126 RepID=UPI001E5B032D|nr:DUF6496 domain-containing protein [Microvirga roseola]
MARHQTKAQKETVERVMHEYKHGKLRIRGNGPKVQNPKQAIAIALHEAGASNQESPQANRENLRRTKARERRGKTAESRAEGKETSRNRARSGRTKAELYDEAKHRRIPGRSRKSKSELERILRH